MKKKLRVMIVEDEACIRDSLTWHLEDLGYQVTAVSLPVNCHVFLGEDCTLKAACTDALIIDQHLTGHRGLDFIKSLVEHGCKGMRGSILLMSGDTTSIDKDAATELGVTVAQKPVDLKFIEEWLERTSS